MIDPRVSEMAALAHFHLRARPAARGLVAAMAAVLVDEGLVDHDWLAHHVTGVTEVLAALREVPISTYCEICGVDEALWRRDPADRGGDQRRRVEDLGVQMNRHSTLVSYLEKLVWLLTGNLANEGGQYAMTGLGSILRMSRNELHPMTAPVSPVVGSKVIGGLSRAT